jgi:hypothetical protein
MQPNWISISDSIPPDHHDVIVYCPSFDVYCSYIGGGFIIDGKWHFFGEYSSGPSRNVTHWMEYPAPPKGA